MTLVVPQEPLNARASAPAPFHPKVVVKIQNAPPLQRRETETIIPAAKTHPLSVTLLLAAVVLIGLLTLPATLYGGDPVAWQAEARSILIRGELNVPSSLATNYGEPGQYFVLNHKNGKYYS